MPELCDLAMNVILNDDQYSNKIKQPHPNNRQLWESFPIFWDKDVYTGNCRNQTQCAGLLPVTGDNILNIDAVAQYTMHHGQLGGTNPIHSMAMNLALQSDQRSIFGYSLGHALGPHQANPWA